MTSRLVVLFAAVIAGFAVSTVADGALPPQAAEPRVIEVLARRYAFEPSQIDVTQGERVRLLVRSGDGMHGFEIRNFDVSEEIPRGGGPVVIEFTADEPGRFPILCSLFCGSGHDDMKGALVVQARERAD